MINDELLNKFARIKDLPVSEEMLGAYMESRLRGAEFDSVSEQLASNSGLRDIFSEVIDTNVDNLTGSSHLWDIYEGDYGYWELGLPPVLSPIEEMSEDDEEKNDNSFADSDRIPAEETLSIQNTENNLDDKLLNSSVMANNSKTIIYGEAGQNIYDPVYVQQPDDHSCALRCQQILLRDFGIDIPFKDLEQIALDNQIYTNEGTYTYDIGKVLQLAGVGMHQVQGSSLYDLINELTQGHRVIVSVDANELWYTDPMSKLKNWFDDAIGNQGGNHALIVAGVEVNPNNTNDVKVVLTDPGAGHLRIEYPLEQFMDAWKDSKYFMAATNDPAPYQYDAQTGMEVPSNFMVDKLVNDFISLNSYQLSPDLINIPQDYQPTFMGHLAMVGSMDYETFETKYNEILDMRLPSDMSIKAQIEQLAKEQSIDEHVNKLKTSIGQDNPDSETTLEDMDLNYPFHNDYSFSPGDDEENNKLDDEDYEDENNEDQSPENEEISHDDPDSNSDEDDEDSND